MFSTPLILTQRLDSTAFVLLASDSSHIPIRFVAAIREDTLGRMHDIAQRHKDSTIVTDTITARWTRRIPPCMRPLSSFQNRRGR